MDKKVLVVASTMSHIENFHKPYIEELRKTYEVFTMAKSGFGGEANYPIDFEKKIVSFKNFRIVKQIRNILVAQKFDCIILNTSLGAFYVRLALRGMKNRPKVISIVHGYLFDKHTGFAKSFFLKNAEKLVKNQTDYIVTMNEEDFAFAKSHKLCNGKVFKIKGMGIDAKRCTRTKTFGEKKSNGYIFTFVGELSKRKNQKFLIKFIKELEKIGIDAKLNLVGYGKSEQEYKDFAKNLGVEEKINFCGYDHNIEKYFDETDFYISSSKIEGSPFNIYEAMQAGQVVICNDAKGGVDAINDRENGIIYEYDSMESLVSKFLEIKDDIELQKKISKNAIITAKEFELGSVFKDNINLLKTLIEETKSTNGKRIKQNDKA